MKSRKASTTFIFITMLLTSLGFGLTIPVLPDLIRRFHNEPNFVAQYYGYFISVYALMQFIGSPTLGSLSDRYGRRPLLLISLLGEGIDFLMMAFAPNLTVLFIGRAISGLLGASHTVATAYVADVSDDSNRSANFGLIGAAFGVGFILGPALGGLCSGWGPTAPFLCASALNLLNFAFGFFVLPESLPEEKRREIEIAKLNPFSTISKVLRGSESLAFIWAFVLLFLAGQVHPSNWTLYTQVKFGWTSMQVGLSLTFVGVVIAIAQGGLTRVIIPRIGEPMAVLLGVLGCVVTFAGFAFATQGWMMYVVMLFFGLTEISVPALQSMISSRVPANEQGELQGSLTSLGSLTAILGPLLFNFLFAHFTRPDVPIYFPGVAYLAAATICLFAAVVLLRARGWGYFWEKPANTP